MVGVLSSVIDGPEQPTVSGPSADADVSDALSGDEVTPKSEDEPSGEAVKALLNGCRALMAEQSPALRAADRSLDQWGVHVDAMNQLVAGEITLDQAHAFWEQSRNRASRRVALFEQAETRVRAKRSGCPREVDPGDTAGDTSRLRPCVRDVNDRTAVIAVAATSIAAWNHHIHDMELLRAGEITPEQATQMWLESWREGQRELDAYHDAARGVPDGDSC